MSDDTSKFPDEIRMYRKGVLIFAAPVYCQTLYCDDSLPLARTITVRGAQSCAANFIHRNEWTFDADRPLEGIEVTSSENPPHVCETCRRGPIDECVVSCVNYASAQADRWEPKPEEPPTPITYQCAECGAILRDLKVTCSGGLKVSLRDDKAPEPALPPIAPESQALRIIEGTMCFYWPDDAADVSTRVDRHTPTSERKHIAAVARDEWDDAYRENLCLGETMQTARIKWRAWRDERQDHDVNS